MPKRHNGPEAEASVDKDSGEGSQRVLKLDFSRLRADHESQPSSKSRPMHVKQSEDLSKSLWMSSEPECVSPIEVNLKNLNFSQLVYKPDGSRHDDSDNPHNFTLGEDELQPRKQAASPKDKSSCSSVNRECSDELTMAKIGVGTGYDTPYLGMKVNPSYENLIKLPGCYLSDEDEETYMGKKIVCNKNLPCDVKSVDLVINQAAMARQALHADKPDAVEPDSDESVSDDEFVRDESAGPRQSRCSYYQSLQAYKRRTSKGPDCLQTQSHDDEESKQKQVFGRLIWGDYSRVTSQRSRDSQLGDDCADDEAAYLDGPRVDPISFLQRGVIKRKKIARLSKSSTKYKPFYSFKSQPY